MACWCSSSLSTLRQSIWMSCATNSRFRYSMLLRWRRLRVSGPGQAGARPGPGNRRGRRRPRRSTGERRYRCVAGAARCARRCRVAGRGTPGTCRGGFLLVDGQQQAEFDLVLLQLPGRGQDPLADPGVAQAAGMQGMKFLPSSSRSVLCRCTHRRRASRCLTAAWQAAAVRRKGRPTGRRAGAVRAGRACCRPTRRSSHRCHGRRARIRRSHHGCRGRAISMAGAFCLSQS